MTAALVGVDVVGGSVAPVPTDAAQAATALPGWLHTSGSAITTSSNKTYIIKAVAWFGMETSTCAPHGLWSISLDRGLAEIRSMGFNTIRLPFSNECLAQKTTNSIDLSRNPGLAGKTPLQLMDVIVKRAKAYGLNVILDQHRPDSSAQSELWYTAQYSEARWISDWKKLAKRYRASSNVIGFDLHNEPHGSACWGCGIRSIDWRAAATRAGNAVLKVNPKLLIVIEGVERQSVGLANTWWGGGLAGVASKPVKLSVAHRVVYSPHDYPSTIYNQQWFQSASYPRNLPGIWTANWGYIDKKNIAPILLGEFGTKLESTSDKLWLAAIVSYLHTNGMSFAYWSFNPNSGDTGGLVADDWTTKQSLKLAYLKPLLGKGSTVTPTPPHDPPAPPKTPPPAPPVTATKFAAKWTLQSVWNAGYVAQFAVSSSTNVSSWSVSWPDASATSITSAWGMSCSLKRGVSITCTGSDWAEAVPAGQTMQVGLQVAAASAPSSPKITVQHR